MITQTVTEDKYLFSLYSAMESLFEHLESPVKYLQYCNLEQDKPYKINRIFSKHSKKFGESLCVEIDFEGCAAFLYLPKRFLQVKDSAEIINKEIAIGSVYEFTWNGPADNSNRVKITKIK